MASVGNAGKTGQIGVKTDFDNPSVKEQTGKRAVGDGAATFFKGLLSVLSAPFRGIGYLVSLITAPKDPGLTAITGAKLSKGDTFTPEEKQKLKEHALASNFYKECGKEGSPISQREFESNMEAVLNTPATVLAMKKHGVNLEQANAISLYTSQNYVKINGDLRSEDPHPSTTELAKEFDAGLARLPSHVGVVYRGAKLPEEAGNQYQTGNVVSDKGIVSSTFDPKQKFTHKINYDIQIVCEKGGSGKDISAFSDKPEEMEVAFPTKTEFQVLTRIIGDHPEASQETHRKHPPDSGMGPAWVVNIVMKENQT